MNVFANDGCIPLSAWPHSTLIFFAFIRSETEMAGFPDYFSCFNVYHLGYEVGRYISLERLIEQHKDRYYETLEQSSRDWHKQKHDPWPFINYVLFILKIAYKEFEERLGQIKAPHGEKTELIIRAISNAGGVFRVADIRRQCPAVSVDLIRRVLKNLRSKGQVECLGKGQNAGWQKTANWQRIDNTH